MIFKNKKNQKLISAVLLISVLLPTILFSTPNKAEAIWGVGDVPVDSATNISTSIAQTGTGATTAGASTTGAGSQVAQTGLDTKKWYEEIYKQVLMTIAKRALQEVTKGVVNWINSGFHGSPMFLENPESFFKDIAKSEIKNLVDMFGYDSLKYPFGKDFAKNTINMYKQTLENNASYSLSKVMTDPEQLHNYQNNFNYGGWNAFLVNTQYPQNNYIGFQMLATEELARRVQGTASSAAEKIKDVVAQGQGFLSPQKCMDPDTKYNDKMANQFQRPSFDEAEHRKNDPPPEDFGPPSEQEKADWTKRYEEAKANWAKDNTCKNLVATTPGTVVADQIKINLGSSVRQKELAASLGNSLSAIFDALLDQFIQQGLNSLSSDKNSEPKEDAWTYDGMTLGSPEEGGINSSWDSGPDEEVILDKFKKLLHGKTIVTTINADGIEETKEELGNTQKGTYIPGDIANLEMEIILIDEKIKLIPKIGESGQTLDQCIPGPDKDWEKRLKNEEERMRAKLLKEQASEDDSKIKASNDAMKELKVTVNLFKDWITMRMLTELPGTILFLDAIKKLDDFPLELEEAKNLRRKKSETVARLKTIAGDEAASVKTGLAALTIQPETGSTEERILVLLKKQYNALKSSLSSGTTLQNIITELDTLKDHLSNVNSLTTRCQTERVAAGWDSMGGRDSKQNNITELAKFCEIPIVSGYSHGEIVRPDTSNTEQEIFPPQPYTFRNPLNPLGNPGFQDLPMVNAKYIYGDKTCTGACSWPGASWLPGFDGLPGAGTEDKRISIEMDCTTIFKASKTDYTHGGDLSF